MMQRKATPWVILTSKNYCECWDTSEGVTALMQRSSTNLGMRCQQDFLVLDKLCQVCVICDKAGVGLHISQHLCQTGHQDQCQPLHLHSGMRLVTQPTLALKFCASLR